MAARTIKAISNAEFSQMLRKSRPLGGWSDTLGMWNSEQYYCYSTLKAYYFNHQVVANSGGPDSSCLLFLLDRHIKEHPPETLKGKLPKELVSIAIDHDLQTDSLNMANVAAKTAAALGIRHITEKLPWGQEYYPPKPEPGESLEGRARDMRYALFLEKMKVLNANALALGHHCDDQVETMLMRLGRSSGETGLAGMRPRRRWGMGKIYDNGKLVHPEFNQMNKWLVRPLLFFEKVFIC